MVSAQELIDKSNALEGFFLTKKNRQKSSYEVLEDCYMVGFDNPFLQIIPNSIRTIKTSKGNCSWYFQNGFILLSKKKMDKLFPKIKEYVVEEY